MMSFTHVLYAKQICEHISLKYGITLKRYSFIYGSVKPDVSILFLGKRKHYFDVSLDMVTESANILINAINSEKEIEKWLAQSCEIGLKQVCIDIEGKWYIPRKQNVPDHIANLIAYVEKRTKELDLGLFYYSYADQFRFDRDRKLAEQNQK